MRLSPILSIYISRHFLTAFFGGLGVIVGLIFLFDVIELLRRAATHGHASFGAIMLLALLKAPQMAQQILPFAVMIGTMVCFWGLTRSRELVVSRAAGISVWQFLAPVMGVVLLIGIGTVTAFNPLSAKMFQRYEALERKLELRGGTAATPLAVGQGGLWLREVQEGGRQVVVHAAGVRQENGSLQMSRVSVFVLSGESQFVSSLEADSGTMADGAFHLTGVRLLQLQQPVSFQDSYDLPTGLTISRIQDNFAPPETISFWELPGFIRFFENAGFNAGRQKLYFQALLASPLLLCAMVLVASVFSLRPDMRSGGLLLRLAGGVLSGFLFYFFSKIVFAMGLSATLPVWLAAWTPTLVAGMIGTAALLHLEDG